VTVAKEINLRDPLENMGAQMLKKSRARRPTSRGTALTRIVTWQCLNDGVARAHSVSATLVSWTFRTDPFRRARRNPPAQWRTLDED